MTASLTNPTWSVSIRDADSGAVVFEHHADAVLKAASIGKLVLLGYVGAELLSNPLLAAERIDRSSVDSVGDSGIWQHLSAESLTVSDATKLVFATSDNWATNVLLRRFGLDEVDRFRRRLGLTNTVLLDQVRDRRGPEHPATLSWASAAELSSFMGRLWRGEVLSDRGFCAWFIDGLSLSLDLSMVGAPLGLDPLAHPGPYAAPGFANKTGTDIGIRADTGIVDVGGRRYAYACIVNYEGGRTEDDRKAVGRMRDLGQLLVTGNPEVLPPW